MELSRRSFFRGVAATLIVASAPMLTKVKAWTPLYGDGTHDDTEALNAVLGGANVFDIAAGKKIGFWEGDTWVVDLGNNTYRISGPIYLREKRLLRNARFRVEENAVFKIGTPPGSGVELRGWERKIKFRGA